MQYLDYSFHQESNINIIGTNEVDRESEYSFRLRIDRVLGHLAQIIITFASEEYLSMSSTCSTAQIGTTCTFGDHNITINNPFPTGYSCCYLAEFRITGIINPKYSYNYSSIFFNVLIRDLMAGKFVYTANMDLSSTDGSNQYSPHRFDSPDVKADIYSTVAITNYNFRFINKDYPISDGQFLSIDLPTQLKLAKLPPSITIHDGLSSSTISISEYNYRYILIEGAFRGGLAANTLCKFQVDGIQNPYRTMNVSITLKTYATSNEDLNYESNDIDFSVNIDSISEFSSFTVEALNYTVSEYSQYNISFQLGDGNLLNYHYVRLVVPTSIKYCDYSTLTLTRQDPNNCTSNDLDPEAKFKSSAHTYGYHSYLCTNFNGTNIKFNIMCRNPETTKPTGNFALKARSDNTSIDTIFYYSSGSILTMTTGTFISINMKLLNEWINTPNTFKFNIERRSPYDSTDLDYITITLHSTLSIEEFPLCPDLIDPVGMTTINGFRVTCTMLMITISAVNVLNQTFGFTLSNIRNPFSTTEPIYFLLSTGDSGGYFGERRTTSQVYALCAYPCLTCTTGIINNCTSCYTENHAAFEGGISMHMQYINPTNSPSTTCINFCSSHTYSSSATSCTECDITCELCDMTPTYCTKCYANIFLHNNECIISPCPAGYSDNVDKWICQKILGFEAGTDLRVVGDLEVEKAATYRFILKPEGGLGFVDSRLEIVSPSIIGVMGSICESTLGECIISGSGSASGSTNTNTITLSTFLTTNYDVGDPPISLDIYNTYTNPKVSYLFSETEFTVIVKINATIYHSGIIPVGEAWDTGRYTPHVLTSGAVFSTSLTTVDFARITINFTNAGYDIPGDYKIIVTLPPQMSFDDNYVPGFAPLGNLSIGAFSYNETSMTIIDGFGGGQGLPLSGGSAISFRLNNILTPYGIGLTDSFVINIVAANGSVNESQFSVNTGLTVEITQISEFSIFDVQPTSYVTSEIPTYMFSIRLRYGGLTTDHKIVLKIPNTVKNCDADTIFGIEGITAPITNKFTFPGGKYSFNLPNNISGESLIRIGIVCQNPKTPKPC